MNKHRDKLIILDFWATWCGGCIYSLNKLDSISKSGEVGGFAVIPVTYQQASTASKTWSRWGWDFEAIVSDSLLGKIFPTAALPHQVWLHNGKVIATPRHDYATAENIAAVLQGVDPQKIMYMKDEAGAIDPAKPAFVAGNGKTGRYHKSPYSVIARYLPGYRYEPLQYYTFEDTTVLVAVNNRLSDLYLSAYRYEIFPPYAIFDKQKAIVWEIPDKLKAEILSQPSRHFTADLLQDKKREEHLKRRRFGYNLRYPKVISDKAARRYMQNDLNIFFGIYFGIKADIENRIPNTYAVLRLLGSREDAERLMSRDLPSGISSDGTYFRFRDRPFELVVSNANIAVSNVVDYRVSAALVDSTGIDPSLSTTTYFSKAMRSGRSLSEINKELKRYGLILTIENKSVPVVVIRQTNTPH
ncbi:TlpA family protein disulfide reductase [Parapedobacter soli]|uniref:TlpA family protein disulfide reductase n=1 Tax=Parapedobacter soli TaxID=416955 RepID=UPI0021C6BC77|nr:hypothetical protein [Parapedobacter soli]